MTVGDNIRRLREMHELTQRDLGRIAGVSDKAVSTWENGYKEPRMASLKKIAEYFGVSVSDLLDTVVSDPEEINPQYARTFSHLCDSWGRTPEQVAHDLSMPMARIQQLLAGYRPTEEEAIRFSNYFESPRSVLRDGTSPLTPDLPNVVPLSPPRQSRRVPVLGRVPAGVPIEAVTDIVEEIELTGSAVHDGYEYFGLLVTGDSMLPEYRDGDVVILRAQPTAETGDDVVAYIGSSDATLKRLTVTENGLQLRPLNPAYEIRSFSNDEVRALPVTIAGIVVEQRRIRRR